MLSPFGRCWAALVRELAHKCTLYIALRASGCVFYKLLSKHVVVVVCLVIYTQTGWLAPKQTQKKLFLERVEKPIFNKQNNSQFLSIRWDKLSFQ